jgi:hypothetical protein
MLAASESAGVDGLLLSNVSGDASEEDDAFHPSAVLGILWLLVHLLWGQRPLLADYEVSAKPCNSLYFSILERPG